MRTTLESYKNLPAIDKTKTKLYQAISKKQLVSPSHRYEKNRAHSKIRSHQISPQMTSPQERRKASSVLKTVVSPYNDRLKTINNYSPRQQSVWDTMVQIDC